MTIEIGIIISLIGCLIGVVSFIIGQRKSGKDDGMELRDIHRRDKGRVKQYKRNDK